MLSMYEKVWNRLVHIDLVKPFKFTRGTWNENLLSCSEQNQLKIEGDDQDNMPYCYGKFCM